MRRECIEAFQEIVKTHSLTRAAENLHLSQSTISQQLRTLEQYLGVQLIDRNRGQHTIELTSHGIDFIPLAERWMILLHQAETLKESTSHELVIGSVDSLNTSILPSVCKNMMVKCHNLKLQICTNQSSQLYRLASEREIDIGFVSYFVKYPNNVSVGPAFEQRMCVVRNCRDSVPGIQAHPSDLRSSNEILLDWGQHNREWHNTWWEAAEPHVEVGSMLLLRHFLQTKGAWAVMPRIDLPFYMDLPLEIVDLGEANPPNRQVFLIESSYIRQNHRDSVFLFKHELEEYVQSNADLVWTGSVK